MRENVGYRLKPIFFFFFFNYVKQKRIWVILEKETLGPSHIIFMRQEG